MLIGTAGHIDHGKTSLVKRLTGRNTDRLPEEIKRGISIELGYAYIPAADAQVEPLGFIDVPGHERFVHTMLAGATGIDLALLVVAADDGVMPQTEEHLEILKLLGVRAGAIALTKVDAVAPERVDEVGEQLAQWLAPTVACDWPVFALSSLTGEGVQALQDWLQAQAARWPQRRAAGQFRMAVDRVFSLAGVGTIVTGTVHAGGVAVGDEVLVQPSGRRARVRSLRAQDRPAERGVAGQRCALNLAAIGRDEVERGEWVQSAMLGNLTQRLDAIMERTRATELRSDTMVHLHHGTLDVLAHVAVLDNTDPAAVLVSLTIVEPVAASAGDRIVLRDAQARHTLAGGTVVDTAVPARGRRRPERLALLRQLAALQASDRGAALQARLLHGPCATSALKSGWNLRDDEFDLLLAASGARCAADLLFDGAHWTRLAEQARQATAATHEREPEMPGLEQHRLRRMVAPALPQEAITTLLDELIDVGTLVRRGAFVALPSHKVELARDERVRWEKIKPLFMDKRFEPPRVRDIARDTGIAETDVRALLRRVARVGEITLVAHDHFFITDAVAEIAEVAGELARTHGAARAAEFRDRIGTGRKLAIQILEFFDKVGYTRRVRDDHLPRRANPWRAQAAAPPQERAAA
ncbi:MAG: selenocysteine-specific translation elongation factor [Betaproteobacteria bacterium]